MNQNTDQNQIKRDDLRLFLRPVNSQQQILKKLDLHLSLLGILGAALFFATVNVPALLAYLKPVSVNVPQTNTQLSSVIAANKKEDPNAYLVKSEQGEQRSILEYNSIGVQAPITWSVDYNTNDIQTHLENGLVQLKGTAQPGQNGTIIIVGHSSNYAWAKGNYKNIFAPLLKAKIDDKVQINHQGITYTYQITEVYEVLPNRTDLITAHDKANLRLITCTPLGTSKKRLIVDAVQVDPKPESNQSFTSQDIVAYEIIDVR